MKIQYVIMEEGRKDQRLCDRDAWATPEFPPFDSESEAEEVIKALIVSNKTKNPLWIKKIYVKD